MDIIKTFVIDETHHTIDIIEHEGQRVFRADQIAKVIGLANVHSSIAKFGPTEKSIHDMDTAAGPQKITVLTEKGVYKILFASRKPIAEVFRNWVCDVLKAIAKTGIYNLEQEVAKITAEKKDLAATLSTALATAEGLGITISLRESNIKTTEARLTAVQDDLATAVSAAATVKASAQAQSDIQVHNILIEAYRGKSVVYIGKILQDQDGNFMVKLGRSKFIETRTSNHSKKYGRPFHLLKCFETANSANFERFLLRHPDIIKYRHHGDIVNMERSTEAFRMTPEQLQKTINIAKTNYGGFRESAEESRHKEIMQTLLQNNGSSVTNIERDDEDEDDEEDQDEEEVCPEDDDDMDIVPDVVAKAPSAPEKAVKAPRKAPNKNNHSVMRARKIQRYSKDGVDLIETYATMGDCIAQLHEEFNVSRCSKEGINTASMKRTVMYGWRWHMCPRGTKPTESFDIGETVGKTNAMASTVVCKMSEDSTSILEMYRSRSEVAHALGFTNPSHVSRSMNERRSIKGHRYLGLDDVSVGMIDEFTAGGGTVPQTKPGPDGISVLQLHPSTGETIKIWESIDMVMREQRLGKKTLMGAINGGTVLNESKWKLV